MAKACLDTGFGFPDTLRQDTVATIKSLISNFYVFEDLTVSPPNSVVVGSFRFPQVELLNELDQWLELSQRWTAAGDGYVEDMDDVETAFTSSASAQEPRSEAMTDREFHDGLSRILIRARDGHLSYDADCFRAFRYQQGLIMRHVVRSGKAVLKVHYVSPYFQRVNNVQQDISNCDVVIIQDRDASEYIQNWADKHIASSKDANISTP
ncbi:hypothetical protein BG011_000472 [Mortierella polycephala]|uniref:Uncharacterized protein n=1 Tax=Mortierella polycephala TaxID=41804 RepID=A0A9P6UAN4_9FUNG|nr:hypothetical protein BG011_000472 [Mortierella polycephala]